MIDVKKVVEEQKIWDKEKKNNKIRKRSKKVSAGRISQVNLDRK